MLVGLYPQDHFIDHFPQTNCDLFDWLIFIDVTPSVRSAKIIRWKVSPSIDTAIFQSRDFCVWNPKTLKRWQILHFVVNRCLADCSIGNHVFVSLKENFNLPCNILRKERFCCSPNLSILGLINYSITLELWPHVRTLESDIGKMTTNQRVNGLSPCPVKPATKSGERQQHLSVIPVAEIT